VFLIKKKRAENVFLDEKTMDLVFPVITIAKILQKKKKKAKIGLLRCFFLLIFFY